MIAGAMNVYHLFEQTYGSENAADIVTFITKVKRYTMNELKSTFLTKEDKGDIVRSVDRVGRSVEVIEERLDKMDDRLDSMDGRIDRMNGRIDNAVDRMDGVGDTAEARFMKVFLTKEDKMDLVKVMNDNKAELAITKKELIHAINDLDVRTFSALKDAKAELIQVINDLDVRTFNAIRDTHAELANTKAELIQIIKELYFRTFSEIKDTKAELSHEISGTFSAIKELETTLINNSQRLEANFANNMKDFEIRVLNTIQGNYKDLIKWFIGIMIAAMGLALAIAKLQ